MMYHMIVFGEEEKRKNKNKKTHTVVTTHYITLTSEVVSKHSQTYTVKQNDVKTVTTH